MKKLALIILLGLGLVPYLYQIPMLETIKLRTFDNFIKEQEPSGNFTILNITEEDLEAEGGWPLPRRRLAEIHIELINKGAIGVGWVISFPQPDRLGGDEAFAEAMQYGGIMAMFENDNGIYPPTVGTVLLGDDIGGMMINGVVANKPILKYLNSYQQPQGIATAPTDIDSILRRIPLLYRTPDGFVPSFGTEVLKQLAGADTYIIKTNELGIEEITVQGIPPVRTDSMGRGWISWVNTKETTLAEMDVEGTFVFIGVTAKGVMPRIGIPNNKFLEPHKIQASLSESMLISNSPYIPQWSITAEVLISLLTIVFVWAFITYANVYAGVILASFILLASGYAGISMIGRGILLDFTWPMIMQFLTGTTAFYMRFQEQWKLRKQIKGQFGTYLSPDMVDILVKNPDMMVLGGERKHMTFLFTDIVGFTPISEKYMKEDNPEGLVELINMFLDRMTKIILANGGTIDKYMGDCIMAFWNAPIHCEDHQKKAVKSAIEIQYLCEELNREFPNLPPIRFGTGINTGVCIVGNMGSESRFDYSVVGDAVNLSARLEVATRKYDTPILISEATYKGLDGVFELKMLDEITVKGKEIPVKIYAPLFKGEVKRLLPSP